MKPVTLQINLSPRDFWFARDLLAHQIRQWRPQVAEILLVIESRRSRGPFGEGWEEGRKAIYALAESIPGARVIPVDYSAGAQKRVGDEFFGGRREIPAKDGRGGPYYCYFYGVSQAAHNLVFHTDSDMFYGGGSPTWMTEAVELLEEYPDLVVVNPPPAPPRHGFGPGVQVRMTRRGAPAAIYDGMSTRLFLIDRTKFREKVGPLRVRSMRFASLREFARYVRSGCNPMAELPEEMISHAMQARGLVRLEYPGAAPGMWSLHPPIPLFPRYAEMLPRLIERVESGNVPDAQRGQPNMNASMAT